MAGMASSIPSTIGVLASGGLDSSILISHLLREGRQVQPFYVRTGLRWQAEELPALERFLAAIATDHLASLVILDLPLADLYAGHWSLTGTGTPDAKSPDEAVYLPGRNALLIVKPAIWCQLHGIGELALAPLGTSPFDDAKSEFLRDFQTAMNRGAQRPVRLLRPFGEMTKRQVMEIGRGLPLELTFSCIAPRNHRHCGQCNKCAERQAAFIDSGIEDRTAYHVPGPKSKIQGLGTPTLDFRL
jgi:7-cyano-7-deazaguanine synthase